MNWILKNWASLTSMAISLTSLTIAVWTARRANRLVRAPRRNDLLTQLFALNSKLYEAGLLLDECDFTVLKLDTLLERRGRQLPKEARVEYEAGALKYRREFNEIQTELLAKAEPLEEASKSYRMEELDNSIIELQALHATADDMIRGICLSKRWCMNCWNLIPPYTAESGLATINALRNLDAQCVTNVTDKKRGSLLL